MSTSGSMLAFTHVPKAGGRTLHAVLRRQYGREQVFDAYTNPPSAAIERLRAMSPGERDRYRAVSGHIGPDVDLVSVFERPISYITMLRDPVERVLSTYYYVRRSTGHPVHAEVKAMTLDEVLRSGLLPLLENGQTRMLSGVDTEDVGYGHCTRSMLEGAIQNLEDRFEVVGTVERFDESIYLMKERFDWAVPFYRRRNVSQGRPPAEALSAGTLDLIRQLNRLDRELYDWASRRLARRVDDEGDRFASRVRRFRRINGVYGLLSSSNERLAGLKIGFGLGGSAMRKGRVRS